MAKRILGYGKTNSQGIAELKYSDQACTTQLEHSYTGVGAGKIDVIAETTIDGTTITSNTQSFYDCQWYDPGTATPTTHTWTSSSGLTPTYSSEGTYLTETEGSSKNYTSDDSPLDNNITIEFDIKRDGITTDGTIVLQYKANSSTWARLDQSSQGNIRDEEWHHVRYTVENGTGRLFVDDVERPCGGGTSSSNQKLRFGIKNAKIYIKDIIIY